MYVIGTAGHVDHGKSTLVEALTGIDPDRLAEEKSREMTIDLGFAWLALPGLEEEIGVVDVPGHRDFIENMLAGVGGIDLALFVVAADEGVMPQTTEHLAIVDLLEIQRGVIAITKIDIVEDDEWLELVMLDVADAVKGTVLEDAAIVPVSATSGAGLDQLRQELTAGLMKATPRPDIKRPRLPVDRVFTLSGFGTVVTGTLLGGQLQVGDNIVIQPSGIQARIRGLQTHQTKIELAGPGSRVAINLTGLSRHDIARGDVVTMEDVCRPTVLLDVAYRQLATVTRPLKHNVEMKFFTGSTEVMARTRVVGSATIDPGQSGWLQLALTEPVAVVRGDRFILRQPSPGITLGGGVILDPHPGRRHRRFRPEVIERFQTLQEGSPTELLLQIVQQNEPLKVADLLARSGLDSDTVQGAWERLLSEQSVELIGGEIYSREGIVRATDCLTSQVNRFHDQHPLRLGIPREELRSRCRLSHLAYNELLGRLIAESLIVGDGQVVRSPLHTIRFDEQQQLRVNALAHELERAGVNSPAVKVVKSQVGEDVFLALLDLGDLVMLNSEVIYGRADYERLTGLIVDYLGEHGKISAAQVRDLFSTSRKYAIALLEHLDQRHITRRVADFRELAKKG